MPEVLSNQERQLEAIERHLVNYLKSLNKRQSVEAIWELRRLQSGIGTAESNIKNLPAGGVGKSIGDRAYILPWRIEQYLNCISIYSSDNNAKLAPCDLHDWRSISKLNGLFDVYNNARAGVFLESKSVYVSLAKTMRNQMPWQDGSTGTNALSRYAYLYCGDECNKFSVENFGLSISDFFAYGFILTTHFFGEPYLRLPYSLKLVNGDSAKLKQVLARFSIPISELRARAKRTRMPDYLGEYSKSLFRDKPIIRINHSNYCCPFPELLMFRITSGLVAEISGDNGSVRNEVGKRFERYCINIIKSAFSKITVKAEERYGSRKAKKNTPDIRLYQDNALKVIVECKSTKLNFDSKFLLDNVNDLPDRANEIIRGILQIWGFVHHSQAGGTPDSNFAEEMYGIVVTLDAWIQLDKDRFDVFLKMANELADKKRIPIECRIKVIISCVTDIEYISQRTSWGEFVNCLANAQDKKFNGYILHSVFRELYPNAKIISKFDFKRTLNKEIWFWGDIGDLEEIGV